MNRNTESHFSKAPIVDIPRSKFDRSFTHKTTFDAAELVPVFWANVMPGDTISMKTSEIIRMTTPLVPVMDNAFADLYFFYIPNRILWNHWKNFMGENTSGPWVEDHEYTVPQTTSPRYMVGDLGGGYDNGWKAGSLANYLGCPINPFSYADTLSDDPDIDNSWRVLGYEIQSMPIRAYCKIWNEWFRSTALQTPVYITEGDDTVRGHNWDWTIETGDYANKTIAEAWDHVYPIYAETGAKCLPVCKPFDYFTSALPDAQFSNEPIGIPFGSLEKAPVKIGNDYGSAELTYTSSGTDYTVNMSYKNPAKEEGVADPYLVSGTFRKADGSTVMDVGEYFEDDTDHITQAPQIYYGYPETALKGYYGGWYADLSGAVGATVTQIRQAFAIQRFYERVASGGQRYIEQIFSHFHVTNPDYRMQRPEYLGGKRIPISMNQVVTTVGTETQPLGDTGAWSVTSDSNAEMFTKSFTEHGIVMGLICVRNQLTYQQGLSRQFSMKKLFDYYFPEFAQISAQPIYNKELMINGVDDDEVFGYQEAWGFERYMPDMVSGELSSFYPQSLDIWHYADKYPYQENAGTEESPIWVPKGAPKLSEEWIKADKANINRTLAVQNHAQFKADFYFNAIWTRPMPLYSVPGLVDHH